MTRPLPFLALPLLAAACVHPQASRQALTPGRAALAEALRPVDLCVGDDSGVCESGAPPERVRVFDYRCAPLPPRDGEPLAVCRVSYQWIFRRPVLNHPDRRNCVRLIRHGDAWTWDTLLDVDQECKDHGI